MFALTADRLLRGINVFVPKSSLSPELLQVGREGEEEGAGKNTPPHLPASHLRFLYHSFLLFSFYSLSFPSSSFHSFPCFSSNHFLPAPMRVLRAGHTSPQQAPLPIPRDVLCFQAPINLFTPKSDQCQISPAASPEIWHHTVWRTWLFIAHSDRRWLYYQFSLHHSYNCFLKGWENTLFELRSERVSRLSLLNLGVKGRHKMIRATQIMSVLRATPYVVDAEITR